MQFDAHRCGQFPCQTPGQSQLLEAPLFVTLGEDFGKPVFPAPFTLHRGHFIQLQVFLTAADRPRMT